MPMRVVQVGLPQYRVEDSGTPFSEGVSRAAQTLLQLGPELARINAQKAQQQREAGFKQQQLGLEERQFEEQQKQHNAATSERGQRLGMEARRVAAMENEQRAQAAWRTQQSAASKEAQERANTEAIATGKSPVPAGQERQSGFMGGLGGVLSAIGVDNTIGMTPLARMNDLARRHQESQIGLIDAQAGKANRYAPMIHQSPEEQELGRLTTALSAPGFISLDPSVQSDIITRRENLQKAVDAKRGTIPVAPIPQKQGAIRFDPSKLQGIQ